MARSLSWIDSERLAALLDAVSPSDAPAESRGARGGHRDQGEELEPERLSALFESQPEPARKPGWPTPQKAAAPAPRKAAPAPQRTASAPQRTASAPQKAAPTPRAVQMPAAAPARTAAPSVPAFQPSADADVDVRLEEFIDWVVGSTHIDAAFVTDANGLVVVERGTGQIDPVVTCSVDLLLNHVSDVLQSDVDGYVALQRDGLHLVTLWTPTDYGRFYGVLISKAAPHPESLALAGQGFRTLFAN